jgi:hypothetical protein
MEDILKCKICLNKYNINNNEPLILKCGHTYCKACISDKSNDTSCPLCGIHVSFNIELCAVNAVVVEMIVYLKFPNTTSKAPSIRSQSKSDNRKLSEHIQNTKIENRSVLLPPTNKISSIILLIL